MSKNEQAIFSTEEMNNMIKDSLQFQQNGPVTCLGREFPNDQARREYFREELRKKLPELRQIEGFPIGEDDDIINLSDPPYYTACPNPWLNDFLTEWEKEKEQLEAEGKCKADFEVKEPYAYGIKQGKNSAIYNAHTYHTKVPHEVIMRYVLHYTQPGDIVLDGFAGTGMTGVASSACSNPTSDERSEIESDFRENNFEKPHWGVRHSVCGDLSPLCFHISSNYNSSVNIAKLQKAVDEIIEKLKIRFGHFYEVPVKLGDKVINYHVNYYVWSQIVACKNCGQELNIHDLTFDYQTHTLHKNLKCPYCGTEQEKSEASIIEETVYDNVIEKTVSQLKFKCCLLNYSIPRHGRAFTNVIPNHDLTNLLGFIPTNEIPIEGDEIPRLHKMDCNYIHQLYHKRTQYVLAYLYDLIKSQYKEEERPLMFIFTSMLPKLTKMNRYMPQHGSRALVGPMANTLYIPPQGVENNPIDQFEYQAGKVIRAMEVGRDGCAVQIASATNSSMPNESVDYIFTDPPFGSNIMYSELNTVSESWLKVMTNNREEAISNNTQHKGLMEYQGIMTECFREYYRVLKPGKWMTVEFSNTSAAFWNSLQYAIKNAGFIISAITDLNKERGGLHAMIGPTAVKQDLALSCYKPTSYVQNRVLENAVDSIWDLVDEHLNRVPTFIKKNGNTVYITERDPRIIYDKMISFYIQNGLNIPMDSNKFQKELIERYVEFDGMVFTPLQLSEYKMKKERTYEFVPMGIMVSDEANGIEWLKNLLRDSPKVYSEIQPLWLQAINGLTKGDVLPELIDILNDNFIKMDDNRWRLVNMQDDVDKAAKRTKDLLKEFRLYVEAASKPKSKIKQARREALRAGFKQCYIDKDFKTIVMVGDKIPQNLRDEDEVLLQFYEIALNKIG